jgi:hypothetical protein
MEPATLALAALIWHGSTEIAAGPAERGPWQQNESHYRYVDDPSVAVDAHGRILFAWVDQATKDVHFGKQGAAVNVSRSPQTFSWLPRVAVGAEGGVYVLWQEIIFSGGSHGGDILFARSQDGGAAFSAPLNLSNSVAGDGKGRIDKARWHNGSLDVAVGSDGTVYTAWTEYEGALWLRRSVDGGKSFSEKIRLRDTKPARAPALAVHGNTVYLAWTVGDDPSADIRVARSDDGGRSFAAPVIAERSKAYSDAPKLAVDARGTLHLVYADGRRIVYSRSADQGRSFERPRDIAARDAGFPALDIEGKGNLYVLWERFAEHRQLARGLELAVSTDAGRSFSTPVLVPGSADAGWNGSSQGLLMRKLAVSRDGEIAIVNSSFRERDRSRVWLIRGRLAPY